MDTIHVVWIEDQTDLYQSHKIEAALNGITLHPFSNWRAGYDYLRKNIGMISAIILDCYCKKEENDTENPHFLRDVFADINNLPKVIPWYIYSAGQRNDFGEIIEWSVPHEKRNVWDGGWTKGYYSKHNEDDDKAHLFANIKTAASKDEYYQTRNRYEDLLSALRHTESINSQSIEEKIIPILKQLHFPNADFNSSDHFNPLRQVLEELFRGCHNIGLLPDECVGFKNKDVVILESSKFLCGLDSVFGRYGEPGEHPLPDFFADQMKGICSLVNQYSHTSGIEKETDFRKFADANRLHDTLFGVTLIICDILRWFCIFAPTHTFEENHSHIVGYDESLKDALSDYRRYEGIVEKDTDGNYHCGLCLLHWKIGKEQLGNKIRVLNPIKNTKDTKDKYLLYTGKVELIMENNNTNEHETI